MLGQTNTSEPPLSVFGVAFARIEVGSIDSLPTPKGGWKFYLMGGKEGNTKFEDPKVTHIVIRLEISFPDSVVDNVAASLKHCVVDHFISFRPSIEMTMKWVAQKWSVKGSVCVLAMPNGLFYFHFTIAKDPTVILFRTWYYGKHCLALVK